MSTPPLQLEQLGLHDLKSANKAQTEWHGPCPVCKSGEDRFVIFTDRDYPSWNWWCRVCSPDGGWLDDLFPELKEQIDPHKIEVAQEFARKRQEAAEEERRQGMAKFSTREIWAELHERMTAENFGWWETQGIPRDWANFWKLGYTPEKHFQFNGTSYVRPAYTIPKFDLLWTPTNIDYRLVDPPAGVGKYRPEAGMSASAFLSRPDLEEMPDEVFVVEGSKKAAVISIHQGRKDVPQAIGLPSCNSWAGMAERLRDLCGRVWVIFDPDALEWGERFAREVGKAARIIELPVKPDDAFTQYGMTPRLWRAYMRYARQS